jgi:WD40 repeat protein
MAVCRNIFVIICFFAATFGSSFAQIKLEEKKIIDGYGGYIMEAQYSPFQTFFAFTCDKNKVYLFDQHHNPIYSHAGDSLYERSSSKIAFSPNEKYLLIGRFNSVGDIAVYNLINQKVGQLITAHSDRIVTINFNKQGNRFVSTSTDQTAKIFEYKNGQWLEVQEIKSEDKVYDAVFSFDDKYLVVCGNDDKLLVYEQKSDVYELFQSIPVTRWGLDFVDYHPYENAFLAGSSDKVWQYKLTGKNFSTKDSLAIRVGRIKDAKYSPDGASIVLANGTSIESYLINKNGFVEDEKFPRHNAYILSINYSLDGKKLVSSSEDMTAIIWDVSGVKGNNLSQIFSYLGNSLTFSQKTILTESFSQQIINGLDKNLSAPKDEFETSKEYWERLLKTRSAILHEIQKKQEELFSFSKSSEEAAQLKLELKKYDADKEIYAISFCNTEASVAIPRLEAKELKGLQEKAFIKATKTKDKNDVHHEYGNYKLVHPKTQKAYNIELSENPFNFEHVKKKVEVQGGTSSVIINTSTAQADTGFTQKNYALLIATNEYDYFDNLINPTVDVGQIAKDLAETYGFEVEILTNPKLDDILKKLKTYALKNYNEKDQLFIFFAGHGYYDDVFKEGYLIAKDSRSDDIAHTSFLSHSNLRTVVNNIPCKHIFLCLDACFGGTFDPLIASSGRATGIYQDVETKEFVNRKLKYQTRMYLTSGGKEYVPDGRPGQHSPFTRKLLEAFRSYGGQDGILTLNEILTYIEKVDPQPRFGEFGNNEPGSDFLFIKK